MSETSIATAVRPVTAIVAPTLAERRGLVPEAVHEVWVAWSDGPDFGITVTMPKVPSWLTVPGIASDARRDWRPVIACAVAGTAPAIVAGIVARRR